MNSITIITIVVVAILAGTIFGLAWLWYSSCIKKYKAELEQGKHDMELCNELYNNKHKKVVVKAIGYTMVFVLIIALFGLFITGIVFKSNNNSFSINGNTTLVIKSGSMSGYYDNGLAEKYEEQGYNKDLQFGVGDICFFEKTNNELKVGEVYAYSYNNVIITHRLVGTEDVVDSEGHLVQTYYIFRGDNNPSQDQTLVSADKILYHYTGKKIPVIGNFILFAQSYFGIWCLICVLGIIISSDVVLRKIQKLNNQRLDRLGGIIYEQV